MGTLVVWLWPRRAAALTLGPPVLALVAWTIVDESQVLVTEPCANCKAVNFTAPLHDSITFGADLTTRAAGGLVGGFEIAGVVALTLAVVCVAIGLVRHRLPRNVTACLAGGLLAAAAAVTTITYSRAGFQHTIDEAIEVLGSPFNRHVQPVALFLLLGFAPAIAATIRPAGRQSARVVAMLAAGGLAVVFALNLSSVGPTRRYFDAWSARERAGIQATVATLAHGCGPGTKPDRDAHPSPSLSPQITVGLVEDLLAAGALSPSFGMPPPRSVRAAICADRE